MELYELVKKWNSVAETLPNVVDRLVSLKDLHEQGLFSIIFVKEQWVVINVNKTTVFFIQENIFN